jgi:hypothetical protein
MLNEPLGWLSVICGFLSGAWFGLNFDKSSWLGGYDALQRRMVRLGHIAFIALGLLNILFAVRADYMQLSPATLRLTSWLLIVGCFSMPLCCFLFAWRSVFKPLFVIPVVSLVSGAGVVLRGTWP